MNKEGYIGGSLQSETSIVGCGVVFVALAGWFIILALLWWLF